MKKVYLVLLLICIALSALSDTVIQMEPYGGVYRIPCVVNGAKMKFIFDTGASDVCISMTMAEYLYDNGYLEDDDIKGVGSSSVADGRIVDHIKIILRDIQIDNLHIYNVEAVVVDGQNAPLLMGQSAIKKLGPIEINGNILTIHNESTNTKEGYISEIYRQIKTADKNQNYSKVIELYETLSNLTKLSDIDLYSYAEVLTIEEEYENALEILNQIEDIEQLAKSGKDAYYIYAYVYFYLGRNNPRYYSRAISFMKSSNEKVNKSYEELARDCMFIADCYYCDKRDQEASNAYGKALNYYALSNNITLDYLLDDCFGKLKKNEKSYRNDNIDEAVFQWVSTSMDSGALSADGFFKAIKDLARNKNRYAVKHLNDAGIFDY